MRTRAMMRARAVVRARAVTKGRVWHCGHEAIGSGFRSRAIAEPSCMRLVVIWLGARVRVPRLRVRVRLPR